MAFIALPKNLIHFKEYTEQDVHMVGIGGGGAVGGAELERDRL